MALQSKDYGQSVTHNKFTDNLGTWRTEDSDNEGEIRKKL